MTKRYLATKDVAKLIRVQLKKKFPTTKFSVVTDSYSMGSAVRISWTDGPTDRMVNDVVKPFQGVGFDGMIDMQYYISTWLLPDGSAVVAKSDGTTGSRGVYGAIDNPPPCEGAELISTGCWVTTSRKMGDYKIEQGVAAYKEKYSDGKYVTFVPGYDTKWGRNHATFKVEPWDSSINHWVMESIKELDEKEAQAFETVKA